jgi:hypothetical protein
MRNIEKDDSCAVFFLNVWTSPAKTDVIWPEKETYENIIDYRDNQMGSYFFSCQMENDPVPPEERTFDPKDFRYYEVEKELDKNGKPQEFYVCGEEKTGQDDSGMPIFRYRKIPVKETTIHLTVDPAFGLKAHNDHVGMIVAAHWIEPKSKMRWMIVLETVREKMDTAGLIRNIDAKAAKYGLKRVHIEYHGLQTQIMEQAIENARYSGRFNLEVIGIKRMESPFVGKIRVTRLEPYYETHRIWHSQSMRNGDLEQELLGFVGGMSRGASDDLADAMSDQCDIGHRRKVTDYNQQEGAQKMDGFGKWTQWNQREDKDLWRRI